MPKQKITDTARNPNLSAAHIIIISKVHNPKKFKQKSLWSNTRNQKLASIMKVYHQYFPSRLRKLEIKSRMKQTTHKQQRRN